MTPQTLRAHRARTGARLLPRDPREAPSLRRAAILQRRGGSDLGLGEVPQLAPGAHLRVSALCDRCAEFRPVSSLRTVAAIDFCSTACLPGFDLLALLSSPNFWLPSAVWRYRSKAVLLCLNSPCAVASHRWRRIAVWRYRSDVVLPGRCT